MKTDDLLADLPGENIVRQGLADLADGQSTASACLVSIASSRFRQAGLIAPGTSPMAEPELQLYRLLRNEGGDAYSRYNALLRELISFEQALAHRLRRLEPGGSPRLVAQI